MRHRRRGSTAGLQPSTRREIKDVVVLGTHIHDRANVYEMVAAVASRDAVTKVVRSRTADRAVRDRSGNGSSAPVMSVAGGRTRVNLATLSAERMGDHSYASVHTSPDLFGSQAYVFADFDSIRQEESAIAYACGQSFLCVFVGNPALLYKGQ